MAKTKKEIAKQALRRAGISVDRIEPSTKTNKEAIIQGLKRAGIPVSPIMKKYKDISKIK